MRAIAVRKERSDGTFTKGMVLFQTASTDSALKREIAQAAADAYSLDVEAFLELGEDEVPIRGSRKTGHWADGWGIGPALFVLGAGENGVTRLFLCEEW